MSSAELEKVSRLSISVLEVANFLSMRLLGLLQLWPKRDFRSVKSTGGQFKIVPRFLKKQNLGIKSLCRMENHFRSATYLYSLNFQKHWPTTEALGPIIFL